MFNTIYKNKKVFITGHTGFKGSWLALWLRMIGSHVTGYSLAPPTHPNHFDLLNMDVESVIGDIRKREELALAVKKFQPDIVFHLAAQSLVRDSYKHPVETFETNVMGTISLLEACRQTGSVRAIINVTSDKCYENKEWIWGYRENEPMGGYDPYSCSKGCSELVTASYRKSFFNLEKYQKEHHILLASVRAGNVIGGGDWANDRLVPDIIKATAENKKVIIRNPNAVRPWQHVLEPLSGYLLLGQKLLEGKKEFADAWNFGPQDDSFMSVGDLVNTVKKYWNSVGFEIAEAEQKLHEAVFLKLDSSKAHFYLQWKPAWDKITGIRKTVEWYRAFYEDKKIVTLNQIEDYMNDANAC